MSGDDDGGPTPPVSPDDSDGGFDFGGVSATLPAAKRPRTGGRRKRVLPMASTALCAILLMVDGSVHAPKQLDTFLAKSIYMDPHYDSDNLSVVGVLLISYAMRSADSGPSDDHFNLLERQLRKRHRWSQELSGHVEYNVRHKFMLDTPVDVFGKAQRRIRRHPCQTIVGSYKT